jgi:hypothetical protein
MYDSGNVRGSIRYCVLPECPGDGGIQAVFHLRSRSDASSSLDAARQLLPRARSTSSGAGQSPCILLLLHPRRPGRTVPRGAEQQTPIRITWTSRDLVNF